MIESAKDKKTKIERSVSPQAIAADENENEFSLRPKNLTEYIGQSAIKKHLRIAIDSAKIRKEPLEHILLYWPPWLGKTTLSAIIATEMSAHFKATSGPAIEKQADLVSILTALQEGDVLFIDEIHRLRPAIEEILYGAMEDFSIDIMLGSGPGATSVKMNLPKFTLIGATTKLSHLTGPLRDRFGNVLKLDFYETEELQEITKRSLAILGAKIDNGEVHKLIAQKGRWTPRIINRFVKIIRDYQTVWHATESAHIINDIFTALGVDLLGLDTLDRKLLQVLADAKNVMGLSTLAAMIGEEEATIEDVVEPYLLKIGFLERTARWRKLTQTGEEYVQNMRL